MKRSLRSVVAVLALALTTAACGSKAPASTADTTPTPGPTPAPETPAADTTTYYLGHGDVMGMDGTVYVDDAPTLVERTVSPATKTIYETVWVEFQHAMVTTTLRQTADPQVFEATDANASFTGTLTYDGDPWNPKGWTYDITLAGGGGKITGTAQILSDEIWADKLFTGPDGTPQARIKDVVRKVTKDEYLAKRKEVAGE